MKADFDVIVIGGGPAGMMAAGRAAELLSSGGKVLLLEKNRTLGKKLLITGGGRCNVTNAEPDTRILLAKYEAADKFLFSPFSQFDNKDAINFFNVHGLETKIENEGRVFPLTNKAESVWQTLVGYMKAGGVTVESNAAVERLETHEGKINAVVLKDGRTITGRSFVLATGGMSRPETGSTGDGFKILRAIGHEVAEPSSALVPVAIEDEWVKKLSGVSLPDAKIRVYQDNAKQSEKRGKLLFTHFGISGPAVLNLSREIGELLTYADVHLSLDLLPDEDFSTLNDKLQELFKAENKKKFKNALSSLIPSAFVKVIVEKSGVDADKPCNSITREERLTLMHTLKDLRMKVSNLLGTDKAIITSGGAELAEIDTRTFASKLFPNLYIVGDMLNINRPSGGYSLQLAWTSGHIAGSSAAGLSL